MSARARAAGVACMIAVQIQAPAAGAQESFREELRDTVETWRADWRVPGVAVAVIRGDDTLILEGFGEAALGGGIPVGPETLFELGSASKTFTATALALLVDEGALRWRDRVEDRLPGFRLRDPLAQREITVLDLLTHRSGIGRYDLLWLGGAEPGEIVRKLRYAQPSAGFRESFVYSNHMYVVAGEVLATAAGMDWQTFLVTRVLSPLGMGSSHAGFGDSPPPGAADPHVELNGEVVRVRTPAMDAAPAGAVLSSAHDLVSWMRYHLAAEEGAIRDLQEPRVPLSARAWAGQYPRASHLAYGTGWFVSDYAGRRMVDHLGGIGGMVANVTLLPDEGIGVAVLTNHGANLLPLSLTHWILDELLEVEPPASSWNDRFRGFWDQVQEQRHRAAVAIGGERDPGSPPAYPIETYKGVFTDSVYGETHVEPSSAGLRIRYGRLEGRLEPWRGDTFRIEWSDPFVRGVLGPSFAWFDQNGAGRVTRLTYTGFPGELVTAERRMERGATRSDGRLRDGNGRNAVFKVQTPEGA